MGVNLAQFTPTNLNLDLDLDVVLGRMSNALHIVGRVASI
jgi:hypothetical protein